jgi:TatD DNase family protein
VLVDSHCHLDASELDRDREAVIRRAREAGVERQIVPAIDAAGWPKLRDICAADPGLYPAYGLHPMFLSSHREEHLTELHDWIAREQPVAIGECGLDFFVEGLDAEIQQHFFDGQLVLARDFDLPVIVHARRAVDAVIAAIKRVGGSGSPRRLRGVVHSFSGSIEQARQLWDLGFLIGLGGPVTYDRAKRLHRLVVQMPLDRLLLETDSPDQPDSEIRGQRNEPGRLPFICETIARLRDEEPAAIAAATTRNAERLFGIGGA